MTYTPGYSALAVTHTVSSIALLYDFQSEDTDGPEIEANCDFVTDHDTVEVVVYEADFYAIWLIEPSGYAWAPYRLICSEGKREKRSHQGAAQGSQPGDGETVAFFVTPAAVRTFFLGVMYHFQNPLGELDGEAVSLTH